MINKKELLRELLQDEKAQFSDEEFLQMLLEQKAVQKPEEDGKRSLGQRVADGVAKFAGSWAFIFCFLGGMALWMCINVLMAANAFDSYPFILLNLLLSLVAAVQAPLIMMSQNRQEEKDRARAESDYRVNLKNELLIGELYKRTERILAAQNKILKLLEDESGREEKTSPMG